MPSRSFKMPELHLSVMDGKKRKLSLTETVASGKAHDGQPFELARTLGGFDYFVRINGQRYELKLRRIIEAAIECAADDQAARDHGSGQ